MGTSQGRGQLIPILRVMGWSMAIVAGVALVLFGCVLLDDVLLL